MQIGKGKFARQIVFTELLRERIIFTTIPKILFLFVCYRDIKMSTKPACNDIVILFRMKFN